MSRIKLKYGIPALLAILLTVTGLALTVYLTNNSQNLNTSTNASPTLEPKEILISNITNNSFSVSWLTEKMATGYVVLTNSSNQDQIYRDLRDTDNKSLTKSNSHYVNVTGLTGGQEYNFYLYSQSIKFDNGGNPYQVTTAPASLNPAQSFQISGKVVNSNREPASFSIISINSAGMTPQTVMTDNLGVWRINLSESYTTDLKSLNNFSTNSILNINASYSPNNKAIANINYGNIKELPTLILGKSYDFTVAQDQSANTVRESQFRLAPELGAQGVSNKTLTIWNPQENEVLNTTNPLFIGTAPISSSLQITLTQPQRDIQATIVADARGNWQWSHSESLAVGVHTITVRQEETSSMVQSRFTISQSATTSTSPAFESSPSSQIATPTVLIRATNTPTPTRSIVLTPTLSPPTPTSSVLLEITSTPTPTRQATITPSITQEITPTSQPTELPQAGSISVSLIIISAIFILLIFGIFLFT